MEFEGQLAQAAARILGASSCTLSGLRRLSGGASMETWAFDARHDEVSYPLILRRRPPGIGDSQARHSLPLRAEGELFALAGRARMPVPHLYGELKTSDDLGEGLLLERLSGEALPQRIMRDSSYAQARESFAEECGTALGKLHSTPSKWWPSGLRDLDWSADLMRLQQLADHFANPSPVHQLAINWLKGQPVPESPRVVCHGDFRLGNLLLDETGLRAVLDWELAHVGYAGEDIGYLCANVWRFGGQQPVGGIGALDDFFQAYRNAGGCELSAQEFRLWQVYAALGWGYSCLIMLELHTSGEDPSMERAAVGRRLSESEIDILLLLDKDLATQPSGTSDALTNAVPPVIPSPEVNS
ncbi:MAG: phosphotransferase family protein [Pseudomonadota bacterium]